MIRIQLNEKYVIKFPVVGNPDFDQNVYDYRDNLITWGCSVRREVINSVNLVVCELTELVRLDIQDFLFIMSKDNGEVHYFNPWIQVPLEKLDNEIPEGLPYRSYIDSVGALKTHTWRTWRTESNPIEDVGDYAYFISSSFGDTLLGSELILIYQSTDAELVLQKPENAETQIQ